jgi:hypothetical protein
MNAKKILLILWQANNKQFTVAAPNVYAGYGWESDLLALNKREYATEYEIKLTASDFKRDAKKQAWDREPAHNWNYKSKYDMLLEGLGPNRFYYVLPEGVVADDQVPEWAGIIRVEDLTKREGYEPRNYWHELRLYKTREAKMLHKGKADPKIRDNCFRSLYYRYWAKLSQI